MTVEEFGPLGLEELDEGETTDFLTSQGYGVLGLPDAVPYMLPMSFGYDGSDLYFTYVVGDDSRKTELTADGTRARFLVFDAASAFQWTSVVVTGEVRRLAADEWDDFEGVMENAWRPDIFTDTEVDVDVEVYRLHADEQVGYRHAGLPPGFRE